MSTTHTPQRWTPRGRKDPITLAEWFAYLEAMRDRDLEHKAVQFATASTMMGLLDEGYHSYEVALILRAYAVQMVQRGIPLTSLARPDDALCLTRLVATPEDELLAATGGPPSIHQVDLQRHRLRPRRLPTVWHAPAYRIGPMAWWGKLELGEDGWQQAQQGVALQGGRRVFATTGPMTTAQIYGESDASVFANVRVLGAPDRPAAYRHRLLYHCRFAPCATRWVFEGVPISDTWWCLPGGVTVESITECRVRLWLDPKATDAEAPPPHDAAAPPPPEGLGDTAFPLLGHLHVDEVVLQAPGAPVAHVLLAGRTTEAMLKKAGVPGLIPLAGGYLDAAVLADDAQRRLLVADAIRFLAASTPSGS